MERNLDPATRYEIELACGHTKTQTYPPLGSTAKLLCPDCSDVSGTRVPWLAFTDTRLDIRTVRTVAA